MSSGRPLRVLYICTGNICRSPMAQYMTNDLAAARGIDLVARSAGVAAPGQPPPPHALSVLSARGIDASEHRSVLLDAGMVESADLILAMTGRHAREAAVLSMDAIGRTFTLREFSRRAARYGPRSGLSVAEYIAQLSADRPPAQLGAGGEQDDVPDPYGRRKRAYRRAVEMIGNEIQTALCALYPDEQYCPTS